MGFALEDEEQAALDAALSFLDEFELLVAARDEGIINVLDIAQLKDTAEVAPTAYDLEPQSASAASLILSGEVNEKPKTVNSAKCNPNRAREERKKELVYLRNKVVEMEQQLEELKGQAGNTDGASTSSVMAKPVVRLLAGEPTIATLTRGGRMRASSRPQFVWEEIATRQYAERYKAEMENVKLRMMLEGQIKIAKSLESVLKKRTTSQMLELYRESTVPLAKRTNHSGAEEDDVEIFEMLLADLDKSLEEVNAIFKANGLSETEETFQDAIVRNTDGNGIYLEVFACKTMPFDIHATSNAVWLHFSSLQEGIPSRFYYGRQPKHRASGKADKRPFSNARQFVEEDRILIAWRMVYDPVEFSSQPTSGIRFYEKGYILIKRPATRSPDFALMQTCFIMTPERFGPNPWNENTVGRLSNFVVDTTARNIYFSHQMIENYLMDEAQIECVPIQFVIYNISAGFLTRK